MKDLKSGKTETKIYDAVLVCSGHHADKNMVSFPGMENYKGQVIHSHDYREPSAFQNKRVVVVGIGNSGADAVSELSRNCSKVRNQLLVIKCVGFESSTYFILVL